MLKNLLACNYPFLEEATEGGDPGGGGGTPDAPEPGASQDQKKDPKPSGDGEVSTKEDFNAKAAQVRVKYQKEMAGLKNQYEAKLSEMEEKLSQVGDKDAEVGELKKLVQQYEERINEFEDAQKSEAERNEAKLKRAQEKLAKKEEELRNREIEYQEKKRAFQAQRLEHTVESDLQSALSKYNIVEGQHDTVKMLLKRNVKIDVDKDSYELKSGHSKISELADEFFKQKHNAVFLKATATEGIEPNPKGAKTTPTKPSKVDSFQDAVMQGLAEIGIKPK